MKEKSGHECTRTSTNQNKLFVTIRVIRGSHLPLLRQAAIAEPPGRLMPIDVAGGPLCLRGLNQNAVNQTFAPAGVVPGNVMLMLVRGVLPWNVQSASSVGATAPTK